MQTRVANINKYFMLGQSAGEIVTLWKPNTDSMQWNELVSYDTEIARKIMNVIF